jgi:hypothetical protein
MKRQKEIRTNSSAPNSKSAIRLARLDSERPVIDRAAEEQIWAWAEEYDERFGNRSTVSAAARFLENTPKLIGMHTPGHPQRSANQLQTNCKPNADQLQARCSPICQAIWSAVQAKTPTNEAQQRGAKG